MKLLLLFVLALCGCGCVPVAYDIVVADGQYRQCEHHCWQDIGFWCHWEAQPANRHLCEFNYESCRSGCRRMFTTP